MQILLWCFAIVGLTALLFLGVIFFISANYNSRNPDEMNEHEFEKWHESIKCGR